MNKASMRGHDLPPNPSTTQIPPLPQAAEPEPVEPEADEAAGPRLPEGVTQDGATYLLELRHPLRATKDDPDGTDVRKLRFESEIYVGTTLKAAASKALKNAPGHTYAAQFALAAALCNVPEDLLERLNARDFDRVAALLTYIQAKGGGNDPR